MSTAHAPDRRPPGAYLHGTDGPVAIVSGRTAAWLLSVADVARLRAAHRGENPEVDAQLVALTVAANVWRTSTSATSPMGGSAVDEVEEAERPLESMSTSEAAGLLGRTPRGVRLACQSGRLPAVLVDGHYRITRTDLTHYRTTTP